MELVSIRKTLNLHKPVGDTKKQNDPWNANKVYQVKVYDAEMNLKYIISAEEAKNMSWENFKKMSKWKHQNFKKKE
jgi:hypothetical protein|tara:strand:+ start:561 stop:788 length:228 start_codon:yes stop_codon:yes gene_type:complete